jgi:hypothetical protein
MEPGPLGELLDQPGVIEALQALDATVSLGLLDLSAGRADAVRRLNAAEIPVVAWLLLPKAQGYWFNAGNWPQAITLWGEVTHWTEVEGLRWAGVGLDYEPDYREVTALMEKRFGDVGPAIARRTFDGKRVIEARTAYAALVDQIHAQGYPVESYQIPFMVDERRARATLLQRVFGLVDAPADREVLMLYTSFLGDADLGLLWSYGVEAAGVGVGSTGGGIDVAADVKGLTWEALARDLRLAARLTDQIFIFSLEGCVRQGYLERLPDFDWDAPVAIPAAAARRADVARRALQGALWAGSHPWAVAGALAALALLLRRGRNNR